MWPFTFQTLHTDSLLLLLLPLWRRSFLAQRRVAVSRWDEKTYVAKVLYIPQTSPVHNGNQTKPHRTQSSVCPLSSSVSSSSFNRSASCSPGCPRPGDSSSLRAQAGRAAPSLSSSGSGEPSPAPACPPAQAAQQHALPPLVQKAPARARPGAVRAANVKLGVPALLAYVDLWDVGLADLGAGEVDPGVALVALDHRPPGERLHAEASDQVPRIIVCKEKQQATFLTANASGLKSAIYRCAKLTAWASKAGFSRS